jgi:hypothetical protein
MEIFISGFCFIHISEYMNRRGLEISFEVSLDGVDTYTE